MRQEQFIANRHLFPSLAKPGATLTFVVEEEITRNPKIQITDMKGVVVFDSISIVNLTTQETKFELPSTIHPGTYIIRIQHETIVYQQKIVVE